jgi:hypothetical protein
MIKRKRIVYLLVCLFVIVVLPLLNLQNNPVYAATPGWLSGWQYQKSHVINAATGAGTNYQIPIKLYYNASAFGYEERDGQFK